MAVPVGKVTSDALGDATHVLTWAREVIDSAYRAAVEQLPGELRHVTGYHVGWWDTDGRPCRNTGKAIRPALALTCSRAAGGDAGQAAIAAAVAVELVHDFSLLHDDVMDGDLTRRHRPAAWTVFGIGEAVLVGDALFALAIRQLADGAPVEVLATALLELCSGQAADRAFETGTDVGLPECLAMAEQKTGALLGAACQFGALAGGADQATAVRYRRFGRHLGVAFQLVDDLLGIWGDPRVTGKPAGSDLGSRKRTLPVVAALSSGSTAGQQLSRLYQRQEPLDQEAIGQAAGLIEAAGGRTWASAEADRQLHRALTVLTHARPVLDAMQDLRLLAALITRRDR